MTCSWNELQISPEEVNMGSISLSSEGKGEHPGVSIRTSVIRNKWVWIPNPNAFKLTYPESSPDLDPSHTCGSHLKRGQISSWIPSPWALRFEYSISKDYSSSLHDSLRTKYGGWEECMCIHSMQRKQLNENPKQFKKLFMAESVLM